MLPWPERIKSFRGEFDGSPAVAIATSTFHPADYLRPDGRHSPHYSAYGSHANCRPGGVQHASILPGVRDGSAAIAASVVADGVVVGRDSHLESADDHAGRADHPGWIHSLLEARGKRLVPARGPGRPRGCAGCHAKRAQSRSGGRFPENLLARRAGVSLVVLGRPALLDLSPPDPRWDWRQCEGPRARGHRI